ncbi:MAG TPA: ABC transporter substrate-binding protein [Chloroflexota bacterium]|nr:ABC transporter substrate-binding protein [Chloroflexota bacterium]
MSHLSIPRLLVLIAAVGALLLAPALRTSAASRTRAPAPSVSGTLTVNVGYEPASLDPAVDWDTGGETYIAAVYDTLFRAVGATRVSLKPGLATRWSVSRDGKTYTVTLRSGVHFHDGSTLNAQAVKFSFDRFLKAKQGSYGIFSEIKRVQAVGAHTVKFVLTYPFASFPQTLAMIDGPEIVSPKTVGSHQIASNGASYLDSHDAGTGPYELVSYLHNQRIVLKAFPGYWGGWKGKHFAKVVLQWPASSSTQRLRLQQGTLDGTITMTPEDFAAVSHSSGIQVQTHTAQTIFDVRINTTKHGLNNVHVRRALSYAYDYNGVVQGVFRGLAAKMRGVGPTGLKNFFPASHPYTFDLAKAQAELKAAGSAGKNLTFTVSYLPDDTPSIQAAQIFQADCAKIGIKINLQGIPIATYSNIVTKPSTDPDIWFGQWTMDYADDAEMYWSYFYSKNTPNNGANVMYYKDHVVDELLLKAQHATSEAKAAPYWKAAVNRIYQAAPEIWTVQPREQIALRSNIGGYQYSFLFSKFYWPVYSMYRK